MTDLPTHVEIHEEGPREGFQIEPGPISAADKIKLIEALAETGLHHIQAASFVSPRIVPGWGDAEDVVAGFIPKEGIRSGADPRIHRPDLPVAPDHHSARRPYEIGSDPD